MIVALVPVAVLVLGQVRARGYINVLDGLEVGDRQVVSLREFSEQYVIGGYPAEMLTGVEALHLKDGSRLPVPDDTETLSECLIGTAMNQPGAGLSERVCLVAGSRDWGRATGSNMVIITRLIERGGSLQLAASTPSRLVELGSAVGSRNDETIDVAIGSGIVLGSVEVDEQVELESCDDFQNPQSNELRKLAGYSLPDAQRFRVYVAVDKPSVVVAIRCSHY